MVAGIVDAELRDGLLAALVVDLAGQVVAGGGRGVSPVQIGCPRLLDEVRPVAPRRQEEDQPLESGREAAQSGGGKISKALGQGRADPWSDNRSVPWVAWWEIGAPCGRSHWGTLRGSLFKARIQRYSFRRATPTIVAAC